MAAAATLNWRRGLMVSAALLSGMGASLTQAWAQASTRALYTEAQADRGRAVYERSCAGCHRLDLRGDATEEVPPLADEEFLGQWGGMPLRELSDFLRRNMPGNAARSLSSGEYSDVLAYLLKSNKMPAGSEELTEKTPLETVALPTPKDLR